MVEDGIQFYRRHLPHWQPDWAYVFVTYRLAGSLPARVLAELREERERLMAEPMRPDETEDAKRARIRKHIFNQFDNALDTAPSPKWLGDPRVAAMIRDNLRHWNGKYYDLRRYVIMPNHVHILIQPLPAGQARNGQARQPVLQCWPLRNIMQTLKGYTAREANRLLGRKGAFWQDENYDHWVRNEAEGRRIVHYIDANPVRAGLCAYSDDWEWSSAFEERDVGQAVQPVGKA
ncbi:MAG TPA: hypothetical protein PK967_07220 [Candidatus Hydrogenedentes bacterium]|nr:hypothetical protein [Candidatus Hydrogenedentota bacterium]